MDFIPNAPQRVVDGREEEIPVVIAASEDRLGGAIAAINSIQHNTRSNVIFYIVTLNGTADHLRWALPALMALLLGDTLKAGQLPIE